MRKLFLLCLSLAILSQLKGQYTYAGVFQSDSDSTFILHELLWEGLLKAQKELQKDSFHLRDVELVMDGKKLRFWAIAEAGRTKDTLQDISGWDSLIYQKRLMYKAGFEMQDIEHYVDKQGNDHFVALWYPGREVHKVWKFDTWEGLEKKLAAHSKENLYLMDIEAIQLADKSNAYLAIFHTGGFMDQSYAIRYEDFQQFNSDRLNRRKSGFRIKDFEEFLEGSTTIYLAVYRKGKQVESLRTNMEQEGLKAVEMEMLEAEDIRLMDLEVMEKNAQKG